MLRCRCNRSRSRLVRPSMSAEARACRYPFIDMTTRRPSACPPLSAGGQARVSQARAIVHRIAGRLARMYRNLVSRDELVSLGDSALLTAAHRYDRSGNIPFEAFAHPHVTGAMLDGVQAELKRRRFERALAQRGAGSGGRASEPHSDGPPLSQVQHAAGVTVGAPPSRPDSAVERREANARTEASCARARAGLTATDRRLVELLYDEQHTHSEIAAALGCSVSTVQRRERAIRQRLRAVLARLGVRATG